MAVEAARRKFSPEYMNRMDKVIVFRTLKRKHLEKILDKEDFNKSSGAARQTTCRAHDCLRLGYGE